MLAQPAATAPVPQQMSALIIAYLSLVTSVAAQNIDTRQPILREVNGLDDGSLFGYSLVLHQTLNNPASMAEATRGVR